MAINFEIGCEYNFYLKADSSKTIFSATFIGGKDPLLFQKNNGDKHKSYELVHITSDGKEISL